MSGVMRPGHARLHHRSQTWEEVWLYGCLLLWVLLGITPVVNVPRARRQDLSRGSNDHQEFLSIPILFSHKQSMKLILDSSMKMISKCKFFIVKLLVFSKSSVELKLKTVIWLHFWFKINIWRSAYQSSTHFALIEDVLNLLMTYCIRRTFTSSYFSWSIIHSPLFWALHRPGTSCTVDASSVCPQGHTWPLIGYLALMAASDWSLALQLPALDARWSISVQCDITSCGYLQQLKLDTTPENCLWACNAGKAWKLSEYAFLPFCIKWET